MAQFSVRDFEERMVSDKIDPIDNHYMLATLCAVITNKIEDAIAVMTATKPKAGDLTDEKPFLPRFTRDNGKPVEADLQSIRAQQAAAAAMFGGD